MIIRQMSDAHRLKISSLPEIPPPTLLLMVSPEYYEVCHVINPHMADQDGLPKKVNKEVAQKQWDTLKNTFTNLGLKVTAIRSTEGLPDMVFSANQSLPIWNPNTGRGQVILSNMANSERKAEVAHFRDWYQKHSFDVLDLGFEKRNLKFEGTGDAIWHRGKRLLWGGHGFRTDFEAYEIISEALNLPIVTLKLIKEEFYHLDTCFSVLDTNTVAIYPEAFEIEGLHLIHHFFERVIEVSQEDALQRLAANCFCPDGKTVIVQKGATAFCQSIRQLGFKPLEVETSEFLKSGGSVFCLKLEVWQ